MKTPLQTADIERLNQLSGELFSLTYSQGLEAVLEIKSILDGHSFADYEELQAKILSVLGAFYGSTAKPKEAEIYFGKALELIKQYSLSSMLIGTQANLAICKAQCGKLREAIAIWKDLIQRDVDPNMRMHIMNNISVSYADMGDYDRTLEYAYKTLDLAIANKNAELRLSALMNLSTAYENMGEYTRALKYINQALILSRKTANIRRECQCLNNLSLIQSKVNELEPALENAKACLELRKRYFAECDQAVSYHNIGYIYEGMQDYQHALESYRLSLDLCGDDKDNPHRIKTMLNMASIYIQQKDIEQAMKCLEDVKPVIDELGMNENFGHYYTLLSKAYAISGDYEKAYNNEHELNRILDKHYHDHLKHTINKSEADYFRKRIEEQAELYKQKNKELIRKNKLIRQNSLELRRSHQRLEDTIETLNWIVSVISHDVRAPLASYGRMIDMILDGYFEPSEYPEILGSLKDSSHSMYKLVDEMLDGIRLQSRKLDASIELSHQDIITHLQLIHAIYQPIAQQNGISLEFIHHTEHLYALIDTDLLKIVVRNLLNNAVKFTPQGGRIRLVTEVIDDKIVLSIEDTGIGMNKEELRALKSRSSLARKPDSSGIGLGWILCRDSIKKMKGTLKISSEPGQGTTIEIRLNRA